jgi:protein-disulfide isomerase
MSVERNETTAVPRRRRILPAPRLLLALAVAVAGLGTGSLFARETRYFDRTVAPLSTKQNGQRFRVPSSPAAPGKGDAAAPVTIVVFSDLECPHYRRHATTIDRLLDRYPGRVRLVFRHSPIGDHDNGRLAARALEAAGEQGRFWQMHDRLLATKSDVGRKTIEATAGALGLDLQRFSRDIDGQRLKARIDRDLRRGAELGVASTPTTFVNGRLVIGAEPYDTFAEMVEEELAKAPPTAMSSGRDGRLPGQR